MHFLPAAALRVLRTKGARHLFPAEVKYTARSGGFSVAWMPAKIYLSWGRRALFRDRGARPICFFLLFGGPKGHAQEGSRES